MSLEAEDRIAYLNLCMQQVAAMTATLDAETVFEYNWLMAA